MTPLPLQLFSEYVIFSYFLGWQKAHIKPSLIKLIPLYHVIALRPVVIPLESIFSIYARNIINVAWQDSGHLPLKWPTERLIITVCNFDITEISNLFSDNTFLFMLTSRIRLQYTMSQGDLDIRTIDSTYWQRWIQHPKARLMMPQPDATAGLGVFDQQAITGDVGQGVQLEPLLPVWFL